jgi:outer membrane protein TolC
MRSCIALRRGRRGLASIHLLSTGLMVLVTGAHAAAPGDVLFSAPLEHDAFVDSVIVRNPGLQSARHAWTAASARARQVGALADPMVEYELAPASIGSEDMPYGQRIALRQELPWFGKRGASAGVASAEADALEADYESMRRSLGVVASTLFHEYAAATRSLRILEEHRLLTEQLRAVAEASFASGTTTQQEPLQAEIELGRLQQQQARITAQRDVLVARMNALLHRRPELPLPEPAETPPHLDAAAESAALQDEALQNRPELRAAQAQLRAADRGLDLAARRYGPDLEVMGSYESMWNDPEHRWMVGVSMNLPVQFGARSGEAQEARARRDAATAALTAAEDDVRAEVESARLRLAESQQVVRLFRDRLLPAAQASAEAANANYVSSRAMLQSVIEAERARRSLQLEYEEALAGLGSRQAELAFALGRAPQRIENGREP